MVGSEGLKGLKSPWYSILNSKGILTPSIPSNPFVPKQALRGSQQAFKHKLIWKAQDEKQMQSTSLDPKAQQGLNDGQPRKKRVAPSETLCFV
jgi:hypothetical protein